MNKENRIHTIRLNLSDARKAPEINYENLADCKWNDIKKVPKSVLHQ